MNHQVAKNIVEKRVRCARKENNCSDCYRAPRRRNYLVLTAFVVDAEDAFKTLEYVLQNDI